MHSSNTQYGCRTVFRGDTCRIQNEMYSPILQRCRILQKFLDPDPKADDIQNLTVGIFDVQTYMSGKTFTKIRSVIVTWSTEIAANRQTDKRRILHKTPLQM